MPDFYDNDLELENNVEYAGDNSSLQVAYPNVDGEVGRCMATGNSDEAFMAEHGLNMNGATYLNNLDDSFWDCNFETDYLSQHPEFYNNLPPIFQNQLELGKDIDFSGDGFFMCTKPLSEMLKGMGLDGEDKIIPNHTTMIKDYDDWYVTGVVNEEGEVTYSLVKMRDPKDDQPRHGSAVSFVELDIDSCANSVEKIVNGSADDMDRDYLYSEIDRVLTGKGAKANKELLEYFSDPKSEGSYTIAEQFINKYLAEGIVNENGDYVLPDDVRYDEQVKQCQEKLDELANEGIYNKENNTIHIQDKDNLTDDEKSAIMIMLTGNPDIYSYAAENKFHADAYSIDSWKSHAIVSDAGVGEAKRLEKLAEMLFKDKNGIYYREQVDKHKD